MEMLFYERYHISTYCVCVDIRVYHRRALVGIDNIRTDCFNDVYADE